jgi:hypothetical protein
MEWQQHLNERAELFGHLALSAPDTRQRVRARVMATEYRKALTMCNTTEANPLCSFPPDHWMRRGCRRARTGSCAIVEIAVEAGDAPASGESRA